MSESWSAPGGRQLIGQAANLSLSEGCYMPNIHPSPCIVTQV